MLETGPTSLIGRAAGAARKIGSAFGSDGASFASVKLQPVLMWLAGAGYQPKTVARHKGMVPVATSAEDAADRLFEVARPDEPILAARMRADLLVALHRDAPEDPRVKGIFEHDTVLVADAHTGWLVTESILQARIGLFDSVNTLLEKPDLSASTIADMRDTLIDAFAYLSPESQREWSYSEVRLEQGLMFLENRQPSELLALADELRPVDGNLGIWNTVRLFSLAAQMNDTSGADNAAVTDLLGMDDGHG